VVLDGRNNDVPAYFLPGQRGAFNGQIVGLGARGCKNDFIGPGADQAGNLGSLGVYDLLATCAQVLDS
jgi:hypothetical protein